MTQGSQGRVPKTRQRYQPCELSGKRIKQFEPEKNRKKKTTVMKAVNRRKGDAPQEELFGTARGVTRGKKERGEKSSSSGLAKARVPLGLVGPAKKV